MARDSFNNPMFPACFPAEYIKKENIIRQIFANHYCIIKKWYICMAKILIKLL
jgi:hypothetical protein